MLKITTRFTCGILVILMSSLTPVPGALAVSGALIIYVDDDAPPIRVFEPAKLGWENMPYASWQRLRENLGYILHLAAFFLRRGTGGDEFQMSR